MKKLLIVESPSKIKTISKFLGKDFTIMSTLGHVKDLPKKEIGIEIDNDKIDLKYVALKDKSKVIKDIVKQAQNSQAIYLGPDPDREGEAIAFHINQEIEKKVKDKSIIHRITFNEITKKAIESALENAHSIDLNKVSAQQARRVLDRWVGYQVSPVLWRKLAKGLSAGRVQSVALKLICNKEKAIRSFKTEEYWSVEGIFNYDKQNFSTLLTNINKKKIDLKNEKTIKALIPKLEKQKYIISSIKDTKRLKNPAAPFMTSTLQQSGYNALNFNVQKTMMIAQKLYEGLPLKDRSTPTALITYMRTDSLRISDEALKKARNYIKSEYGKDYLPARAQVYSKKKSKKSNKADTSQDAHEAIRPIDISITPEIAKRYLPSDAAKLYSLIWRRFIASQLKPAQYAQRKITITSENDNYIFKTTGSSLIFNGYLKVYQEPEDTDKSGDKTNKKLPSSLKENVTVKLEKLNPKQHFTQPPLRYTEATLVKELEKEGIGRPSTYATILKTIQARDYTHLDAKKKFIPSELGMVVTDMLNENFPNIMNIDFTAKLEGELDQIAHGELERDELLKNFYSGFQKSLKKFTGDKIKKQAEPTDIGCPECKKDNLLIRFGKSGTFLGCSKYPECSFTSQFKRTESGEIELIKKEQPKLLEKSCPKCKEYLRNIQGKFGQFTACSGYPKCKYIEPTKAGIKCITCKKGDIIQKVGRTGKFWGCSEYPNCKLIIPGDIEKTKCPKCPNKFLVKKVSKLGQVNYYCFNKECSYKVTGNNSDKD